ncbi:MAG: ATP-binding protein [Gemmatimonadaceae bacterium]
MRGSDKGLIARHRELSDLRAMHAKSGFNLVLVHGKRRVGKTRLLSHVWPHDQVFYFAAADATGTINRRELILAANRRFELELDPADFHSWEAVFRALLEFGSPAPIAIVLDEFHHVVAADAGVTEQLEAALRVRRTRRSSALVLCGSADQTMSGLQAADSPLRSRFDTVLELQPFDYRDAAEFTPTASLRECAYMYGIFGGMPGYLSAIDPERRLADNVAAEMLASEGKVRVQIETGIDQERGLRHQHEYKAILRAIGAGSRMASEIAENAGTEPGTSTKVMLEKLARLGYVTSERSFGAKHTHAFEYHLADPAHRFHYELVEPFRSELTIHEPITVWLDRIAARVPAYMRRVFELMVRQAYQRHHLRLRLPPVVEWGRWVGSSGSQRGGSRDPQRSSHEIGIVARLQDGRMLTGAAVWGKLTPEAHARHLSSLRALATTGYEWAREALDTKALLLYAASDSVPADFGESTAAGRTIIAWTLEDLYHGREARLLARPYQAMP